MNNILTADLKARRRIREDLHTNFFVEAGAGSGKTTELVGRMAAMVENGFDVEKICAITFTVAASQEFYDRFQHKLIERQADPSLPEATRKHIETALENIDLCFMGTIDAFCSQLLGEHPTRAHVPSTVSLVDGAEQKGLYRREYAKLKHGEYGPALTDLYHKFCAVQSKPDEAYEGCIGTFMEAHAAHWVVPEAPVSDWRESLGPQLDQLLTVLEMIAAKSEYVSTSNLDGRKALEALPDALRALRDYKYDGSFPDLNALKRISSSDNKSKMDGLMLTCEPETIGLDAASFFEQRGTKKTVFCLSLAHEEGLLTQLQEYQYTVTVRFLSAFAAEMAKALKSNGELSFYDNLLYLRDMLREDAANGGLLAKHIRERHSWFLIDEFQDTDPMQAEIFFRLASEVPAKDWRDSKPAPGTLFIVGDPKQSIYRFRGADVNAYLAVKQLFVPPVGEVLFLQQNFRSSYALSSWFNDTFEALLPEETPCQSRFEAIPLEKHSEDAGTFYGPFSYPTTQGSNAADVAAIIRKIVNNPGVLIQTRKDQREGSEPHPVEYRDIMVITRTTPKLMEYAAAMKALNIPCRVEGATSFKSCPAFVAMADIIAAFAEPSNSTSVYRVLRSQPFHFYQEDITAWKNDGHLLRLYGHEEEEGPISEVLKHLDSFRKECIMLPPAALCRAVLNEFRLFQCCGSDNMEYVWFAIELLRSGVPGQSIFSLTDASTFLDGLMTGTEDAKRVLDLNGEQDRVHLANLHKVKGLEAPVVILAQLNQRKLTPAIHMEIDGPSQKRWALRLSGPNFNSAVYAVTKKFKDELSKEKENLEAEATRLMYVAATRAGCALLIPATSNSNLWSSLHSAATKGIDTVLSAPSAGDTTAQEINPQAPCEWEAMVKENPLLHRRAEVETWQLHLPSSLHDSDQESEEKQEPDTTASLSRGQTSSLLLGTIIHKALEMLVSSKATLPDSVIIESIREEYRLEDSVTAPEALSILRNTLNVIRHGGWKQESDVPSDILSELLSADEVHCEVPFCVMRDSTVTSGVMDVVYRKGTAWYVVDYKTNADPYGLDQLYKDQMAAYRESMKQLFGAAAAVHTYHIPLLTC